MTHTIIGQFNIDQLKEIISFLEVQDTSDLQISTHISWTGDFGTYFIIINNDGRCTVME